MSQPNDTAPAKRAIRHHKKSRSGCITCKKRRVKCDETAPTCHNCLRRGATCVWKNKDIHQETIHEATLHRPLATLPPTPLDTTSLQVIHHFSVLTSHSLCSEAEYSAETAVTVPQLAWGDQHLLHATMSIAALHLGRLYSKSASPSSESDENSWICLASAHRKAAIAAIPKSTMNPEAKFISIGFFTIYTISSSLRSSPENIFSLVNSLHNVWSSLEEWYTDAKSRVKPIEPGSVDKKLVPLREIYNPSENTQDVEPEELHNPEIRRLYQQSAEGLCVAYAFSRVGREGKSAVLWPTLFGRRFCTLLNERRQRALVLLYCYLLMLKDVSEGCWWLSEIGRCLEHVHESLNTGWRDWLRNVYMVDGDDPVVVTRCLVY